MSSTSCDSDHASLDQLLAPGPEYYREKLTEWSIKMLGEPRRPLVLFGSGALGRYVVTRLSVQSKPVAFSDNNPDTWGQVIEGIPVLPPEEAISRYGQDACFIVAIYNGSTVRKQLRDLGCRNIAHIRSLFHTQPELRSHGGLADPEAIFSEIEAVRAGFNVWADNTSQKEYLDQLRWRLDAEAPPPRPHTPLSSRYFEPSLCTSLPAETFVDCGAFDGDSLQDFLKRAGTDDRYLGFEPDPRNFARLRAYTDTLPVEIRNRITLLNQAVGASSRHGNFVATATAGSKLSEGGDCVVECTTLDEALAGQSPTVIKMDVEGHEYDTLIGAQETIRHHRPLLVICLYHRPEDLWRLPLAIKSTLPEYSLHVRRYAEDCWELVCYAVPPERHL